MYDLLVRFQHMNRRWIFVGMGLAILLPMLFPISMPFAIDERVRALYDKVEELPEGSTVLLSLDFDPASRPELEPFMRANLDHLFHRNIKVVGLSLWEFAPPIAMPILEELAAVHGKEYGTDWAFLGFKPGKELAIKAIGENIPKAFPTDTKGNRTTDLAVMNGIKQAKDFPLIINVSAGFPGTREYVLQIQGQYDLNIGSACTAVSGPDYIPFYKAGQLVGLSAGMPGSAQYESLVWAQYPEPPENRKLATLSMNVLNLGHAFIVLLILFGNVAYFATRKAEG